MAETGFSTFSSYYGSNMDNTDVTDFANALSAKGWSGTPEVKATLDDFKGARNRNVLYWSGHGLTSGAMTYYDSDREYRCGEAINNDTGHWEYMHTAVVKNTWQSYNSTNGYYTNSNWDDKLNWVILAVCNQLTTPENRNEWACAMSGTHRVKGLMSYNTTAPGIKVGTPGPDNLVAKEFVRLCFDTTGSQRPVYAWIQANNNIQVPGATSLFHAINKDDKLTVITDNGIGVVPSFRQLLSSGSIVQDPFAQTYSLDSLDVQTSYLIDTKDEYREIDDKKAREKFSQIKFDINNSQDVSKKVFEGLKAKNIMPDDASLCEMVPIIIADVAQDGSLINNTVDGYMLKYGHSVNGSKISTDEKGDFVRVTVDKDGICLVEKNGQK